MFIEKDKIMKALKIYLMILILSSNLLFYCGQSEDDVKEALSKLENMYKDNKFGTAEKYYSEYLQELKGNTELVEQYVQGYGQLLRYSLKEDELIRGFVKNNDITALKNMDWSKNGQRDAMEKVAELEIADKEIKDINNIVNSNKEVKEKINSLQALELKSAVSEDYKLEKLNPLQIEYFNKNNPLSFVKAGITKEEGYSSPVIVAIIKNNSENVITGFKLKCKLFNSKGDLLKAYGDDKYYTAKESDINFEAGQERKFTWTVNYFVYPDLKKAKELEIYSVTYNDGKTISKEL